MKKIDVRKSIYFLAFGIGLLSLVVAVQIVKADSWSWTNGTPTIVTNKEVALGTQVEGTCQGTYKSVKQESNVEGTWNAQMPVTDCVIGEGANFKILHFFGQSMAIQFAGDKNAHLISGITCRYCSYLPSKDTFITLESRNDVGSGRVAIYKNFVQKLKSKKASDTNQTYYEFTQAQPDQVLSGFYSDEEYAGYAKHMQKSSNDKWLVVEFVGMGIYRVDMDTMQIVRFSDWRTDYWYAGPGIEFDISNDGQHVAVFGTNSLNTIFDITPDCGTKMGYPLKSENMMVPQQVVCPFYALPGGADSTIVPHLTNTFQPKFSDDGGEISFYAVPHYSTGLPSRFVTLRAANYSAPQQLDYLALGDSYSSGEGDTEKTSTGGKYYRAFTDNNENKAANIPAERCHVSTRSYPYKLATGMSLSITGPKKWDTVACSGATTWDVKSEGTKDYTGQWNRLNEYNVNALKTQALNEMIPGRQKQIEFVQRYKPRAITLTMGGNDVGFADKVRDCVLNPGSCNYVNERKSDLSSEVLKQYEILKKLYEELYKASDYKTKIYVIGYPNFINNTQDAKCDLNVGALNTDERELISSSVTYLNNVIKQAVKAAGVKYIDIESSLKNHTLCDNGEKYVTGISDPLNFSNNRQESFHPNAKGNQAIALDIWSEHNMNSVSLLDYDICPQTDENSCPDTSATKANIVVPPYFTSADSNKNVENKRMTSPDQQINSAMNIVLDKFNFLPGAIVKLVGHSNPIDLGSYVAADDGSLNISVTIPSAMTPGPHTVIVAGKTYSGDDIEYEQSILVKSSNPSDADGDGINDSQDKCMYVQPANKDYDADGIDDACDAEIGQPPVVSPSPTPAPTPSASPSPSPSSSPKPSQTTGSSVVTAIVTQVINIIVIVISLLASLLRKILLRL